MRDEDRGPGDVNMFPAEDLERLYRLGEIDSIARISGRELNKIVRRQHYNPDGWYAVTRGRVKKL